jgi:hypothetical protein
MQAVIAEVLRAKLGGLPWLERTAGLVQVASRPAYTTVEGKAVQTGTQTYPVACNVNVADCWENGVYKLLEPDQSKSGVAFFMDNGGIQQIGTEGPRGADIRFQFNLRLLIWLNLPRLGEPITANGCTISGRIGLYLIEKLHGKQSADGVFSGALEEQVFRAIEVKRIDELQKSAAMFEPFDFAKKNHLFFWPYDYMGLSIQGEFLINKNCLPDFGTEWEPSEGCIVFESDPGLPGSGQSLCTRLFKCMAGLEYFDSDDDGLAGGLLVEGRRFFLAGAGHDGRQYGSIVILPEV